MKAKEFLLSKGIVDKRTSKLLKEYANIKSTGHFKCIDLSTMDSCGWKGNRTYPITFHGNEYEVIRNFSINNGYNNISDFIRTIILDHIDKQRS